jgi:hypothetical protein
MLTAEVTVPHVCVSVATLVLHAPTTIHVYSSVQFC